MTTKARVTEVRNNETGTITRTTVTDSPGNILNFFQPETRTVVEAVTPEGGFLGIFDRKETLSDTTTSRKS